MIENKSSLTKILERVSVWVVFGYLILENISRIIYSVNIFDVSIIDEDLENILFRKALSLIIILFILHSSWLLLTPISSYVYKPERFNKNKQQISNISDFYLFPVIVEFCLSFIVALFWVLILSSDNLKFNNFTREVYFFHRISLFYSFSGRGMTAKISGIKREKAGKAPPKGKGELCYESKKDSCTWNGSPDDRRTARRMRK